MLLTQDQCDPTNPEQAFAWMFAAGVPDPRNATQPGKNFRNQPLIPPQCFGALSKMLWDFGARPDATKQAAWIVPASGAARNFSTWTVTDTKPVVTAAPASPAAVVSPEAAAADLKTAAAAVVVDQFPQVAANLAKVTPATHKQALAAQTNALLSNLSRLQAAREQHEAQQAAAKEGGGGSAT